MSTPAPIPVEPVSEPDDLSNVQITFGVLLLIITIIVGHLVEKHKIHVIHENGIGVLFGVILGFLLWLAIPVEIHDQLHFENELFFDVILPPIIFAAGYTLKKQHFFDNFAHIVVLGVFGTLISLVINSVCLVGASSIGWVFSMSGVNLEFLPRESIILATILASSDTVAALSILDVNKQPTLFGVLAGEGILNDAFSIVLFDNVLMNDVLTMSSEDVGNLVLSCLRVISLSILVGVVFGLFSAWFFKHADLHDPNREIALLFLIAYCAYTTSTLLNISGILTLFLCGVVMSHYTFYNITQPSKLTTVVTFNALGFVAETFIYVAMGFLSFHYVDASKWSLSLSGVMLLVTFVARSVSVSLWFILVRLFKKSRALSFKEVLVIIWGGSIRGSIAFALSLQVNTPHRTVLITTTLTLVLFTTIVYGTLTRPLLRFLKMDNPPDVVEKHGSSSYQPIAVTGPDGTKRKPVREGRTLGSVWRLFDEHIMKPVFGGRSRSSRLHEQRTGSLDSAISEFLEEDLLSSKLSLGRQRSLSGQQAMSRSRSQNSLCLGLTHAITEEPTSLPPDFQ